MILNVSKISGAASSLDSEYILPNEFWSVKLHPKLVVQQGDREQNDKLFQVGKLFRPESSGHVAQLPACKVRSFQDVKKIRQINWRLTNLKEFNPELHCIDEAQKLKPSLQRCPQQDRTQRAMDLAKRDQHSKEQEPWKQLPTSQGSWDEKLRMCSTLPVIAQVSC